MLDLKAGRELDALVAEKVMGWTEVLYHSEGDISVRADCVNGMRTDRIYTAVPCYSSDFAAAWQVVEKVREQNLVMHLHYYPVSPDTPIGASCVFATWRGKQYRRPANGESVPLAICLAALAAVGFSRQEENPTPSPRNN